MVFPPKISDRETYITLFFPSLRKLSQVVARKTSPFLATDRGALAPEISERVACTAVSFRKFVTNNI